jgi:hypothetical protein
MEPIALNDIPRWSPWPARLLGLDAWVPPTRTPAKVEDEYNRDKYARCLDYSLSRPGLGPEEIKDFEFGGTGADQLLASDGPVLGLLTRDEARRRYYDLLADTMAPALGTASTVVELGCGYGYNLWMLQKRFARPRYLGGEFSQNAVELAARLFAGGAAIAVRPFDFYRHDYEWVMEQPGPVVLFTSHSIEQLPQAAPVLRSMAEAFQGRPITVFHFEPVCGLHDDSLLGLLRRRYALVNDYNRDLWEALRTDANIIVRRACPDVFGINPLNPTSVIEWAPTQQATRAHFELL